MIENSFEYRLLASGDRFIDREDEMENLLESVEGGQNITIFSSRRYGKSSLILEAFDRLEERNTVYIDFNRVNSIPELASRLVTGVTSSSATNWIAAWFPAAASGICRKKITVVSSNPTRVEKGLTPSVESKKFLGTWAHPFPVLGPNLHDKRWFRWKIA